jgi:fructose-specific phosphotransferase system component IIB
MHLRSGKLVIPEINSVPTFRYISYDYNFKIDHFNIKLFRSSEYLNRLRGSYCAIEKNGQVTRNLKDSKLTKVSHLILPIKKDNELAMWGFAKCVEGDITKAINEANNIMEKEVKSDKYKPLIYKIDDDGTTTLIIL